MKTLGALLILSPLVLFFVLHIKMFGLKWAILLWSSALFLVGVVVLGVHLINL